MSPSTEVTRMLSSMYPLIGRQTQHAPLRLINTKIDLKYLRYCGDDFRAIPFA